MFHNRMKAPAALNSSVTTTIFCQFVESEYHNVQNPKIRHCPQLNMQHMQVHRKTNMFTM